jgi:hypothetical protein
MLLRCPERDVGELFEELAGELGLRVRRRKDGAPGLVAPDGSAAQTWREGYPYAERLDKQSYAAA